MIKNINSFIFVFEKEKQRIGAFLRTWVEKNLKAFVLVNRPHPKEKDIFYLHDKK